MYVYTLMLSLAATWVLSDAHDRLNAGANYLKRKEDEKKNALSAPCEVNDETGACEKEVCIRSAANLPGHVDSWPRKPAPESWVKLEAGGRLVCKARATHYTRPASRYTDPFLMRRADRQARKQRDATGPEKPSVHKHSETPPCRTYVPTGPSL